MKHKVEHKKWYRGFVFIILAISLLFPTSHWMKQAFVLWHN